MKRRQFLVVTGGGLTGGLAGCLGDDADDTDTGGSGDSGTDDSDDTAADTGGRDRLELRLVGLTAERVEVTSDAVGEVEEAIAAELGLDPIDVRVREDTGTVELFTGDVDAADFAVALDTAGYGVSTDQIRGGITEETREVTVDILREWVDRQGLPDVTVETASDSADTLYVIIETPEEGEIERKLTDLIDSRGTVQMVAGYPAADETSEELETQEILSNGDFRRIGRARPADAQGPARARVTLTSEAAERFVGVVVDEGFTDEGVGQCTFDPDEHDEPLEGEWCLYTVVDDEYVFGASMSATLASTIETDPDGFIESPRVLMQTSSFRKVQKFESYLRSGGLPTEVEFVDE